MPKFLRWLLPPSEPLILIDGYRATAPVAPRPLVLPVAKSSVVSRGTRCHGNGQSVPHRVGRRVADLSDAAAPGRGTPAKDF